MPLHEFYQNHLDRVSRSFAFCIAQLKSPLREWVGLSYLLLRVLDTIEDAPWTDLSQKQNAFADFDAAVLSGMNQASWDWIQKLPPGTPESEIQLCQDFPRLVQNLFDLPLTIRSNISSTVLNMSRGMRHFSHQSQSQGLKLKSLKEVNQYCFFVAGVVGELLTQLIERWMDPSLVTGQTYANSVRFGLCLQKVNLLKDQREDELAGRFLVPNRAELLQSLKVDAKGALDYLLQIPLHMREYRLFCAWSLFLGISSLAWIENSWVQKLMTKIPRSLTESLLKTVEHIIDDNQLLLQHFQAALAKLQTSPTTALSTSNEIPTEHWLPELYKGQLSPQQLVQLGLL